MSVNTTANFAVDRTQDSYIRDPDDIVEKINQLTTYIHLFDARVTLLKVKISKERESTRNNQTLIGDCTEVSQTFYDQVIELWTAVQNYKIRIQNETNNLFNALSSGLLNQPSSPDPEIEMFKKQILDYGNSITPLYIMKMEITEDKKKFERKIIEKQREMIHLIDDIGDKLEQAESHTHPREIQRSNERLMKIKIGRCIMNSIMARAEIDYVQKPELLALKIKWRNPITLKSKTNLNS